MKKYAGKDGNSHHSKTSNKIIYYFRPNSGLTWSTCLSSLVLITKLKKIYPSTNIHEKWQGKFVKLLTYQFPAFILQIYWQRVLSLGYYIVVSMTFQKADPLILQSEKSLKRFSWLRLYLHSRTEIVKMETAFHVFFSDNL